MKLTTAFLLILVLQVSAKGYSQKVTLHLQNVPLSKVFKEINKQTGFSFFYKSEMLKQAGKVTIQVTNADVKEVLNQCLSSLPFEYRIVNETVILSVKPAPPETAAANIRPPDFEVTGTVSGEKGAPLAGASVNLKGTTRGTTTDATGNFTLHVPDNGGVLVISHVAYETYETPVTKAEHISVTMKFRAESVDEVVVVGYGTQRRREVTGAVSQLSGAEVKKSQSLTVSNALSGRVPGLIVSQRSSKTGADGANFSIRGLSTYRDASVLIVVDGVANRDGLDRIDPNDIESITVLKDASAAIYGAQSGNGVILVTTKRGSSGRPRMNYSFNHGFVSPVRLMKMSDAATYARGVNDIAEQNGQAHPYSGQAIADYESGKTPTTDWLNEVYKDHFNQSRHSLNVSGGSDNVKYFLSGGIVSQGSILTNDDITKYNQYNFRSNIDVQLNKRLSIGMDLSGRRQNTTYPYLEENLLYAATVLTPPTVPAYVDGLPARGRSNNNPLAVVTSPAYDKVQYNLVNGTVRFEYKIPKIEGLSLDGFGAVDNVQIFRKRWQQPHYFYEKDANGVLQKIPNNSSTALTNIYGQGTSLTANARLKYAVTFNDVHNLNVFVAVERNETRVDTMQAARTGYVSSQIDELFAGGASNQTNTGWAVETARLNYFGRLAYGFNNKYLFQFQFRYDGSQKFPEDKRFGFFPGVSAGWVLSEENFLKQVSFVNNLKLRASYGLLGNDRIAAFQYLNLYSFSTAAGSGYVISNQDYNVLNPGVAANPEVTWERKKTLDIGIEARVLDNRLSFEIDYFKMRTEDILGKRSISIPLYTGLNSSNLPDENIGIVENKGFDGQINYRDKITQDLSFNVGVNMTYAKNTLVFIDEGNAFKETYQKMEGKPIGAMLLYDAIGIYRTQGDLDKFPGLNGVKKLGDAYYRDVNGDGKITSDDRVRSDLSNTPQLQYGFVFGAQYKGFDLSGNFMGQSRAIVQFDYVFGEGNNTPEYWVKNAWSPSNPNASLPRIGRSKANQGEGSNLNTRDVSFLRLKNIELGYTIPKAILEKAGLYGVRFYINAYNIFTFDKLKKDGLMDPEYINPQGWQFPQTKSVNIGVNVNL